MNQAAWAMSQNPGLPGLITMAIPAGQENANDRRANEFNSYRGLLFSLAYRMLGSVSDAEDILQEAFIRWHRAADTEIESPRAFLVTVVSRLCINYLQSARVRREE